MSSYGGRYSKTLCGFGLTFLLITGCNSKTAPTTQGSPSAAANEPSVPSGAAEKSGAAVNGMGPPALSAPIDPKAVADATGVEKTEKSPDGTIKVSYPRKDVDVVVDGMKLPPFMGLTSWVAFAPGKKGVSEAMMMGDLVLFEDEVNPVISSLLEKGVQVTALHNHFFFDTPHVYFMHVGAEGKVVSLGSAIKGVMDEVAGIRKRTPSPGHTFGSAVAVPKSNIDASKLESIFGVKGVAKDGMFKATMGRKATASCGCPIGKAMGVNTWAAFAGSDESSIVDGDFAMAEDELQGVLKTLRAGGINIVAIHHHMSGETPRILFLHYWGRGKAAELAATVKKALDLTSWDKS